MTLNRVSRVAFLVAILTFLAPPCLAQVDTEARDQAGFDAPAVDLAEDPADGSDDASIDHGVEAGVVPQAAIAGARDAVYPALVNLSVVRRTFSGGRTVRRAVNGSGVVVQPDGVVLTNFHVAQDAVRITATLTTGEQLDATVVAHDPWTDLSVLRLVAPEGQSGRAFDHADLGDSDALEVGDPVLAMGNPLALSSSVSLGIVANPRRVFADFSGNSLEDMDLGGGERTGVFTRWIQHDALILPGNSGGPLVDLSGRVVGINELGQAGLGFAIPARVASRVLAAALEHGRVPRGWLGFRVVPVSRLGFEDAESRGALVSAVLPGSPAERSGLLPGDRVVEMGGEPVSIRFLEEIPPFYTALAALPVGETVDLELRRPGLRADGVARAVTVRVEVEEMAPSRGPEGEVSALGASLREITPPMALSRSLPDSGGLLVTGVRTGSPLAEAEPGILVGDVLRRVGSQDLHSLADLRRAVDEGLADGGSTAVTFRRQRQELVTVIEPEEAPREGQGRNLPRAWLGIRTQLLTADLANALGFEEAGGFRVTEVFPGTAAAAAGLAVGDVIRGLADVPLLASRSREREDLRRAVEAREPGETVALTLARSGGAVERLEVSLEPRPEEPGPGDRERQQILEVAVRDLAFDDRLGSGWEPNQAGALVVEVESGSWAQMAGLRLGDLVLRASGEEIDDARDFVATTDRLLGTRPAILPLFVRRGATTHFVFIEPDWNEGDLVGGSDDP